LVLSLFSLFVPVVVPVAGSSICIRCSSSSSSSSSSSTGYSHASNEEIKLTRQLLKSSPLPLAFASNSPSWHVDRILKALGLAKLHRKSEIFTPDRLDSYPTKHNPKEFFSTVTDDGNEKNHICNIYNSISFLDDSIHNLRCVQQFFPGSVNNIHHINRRLITDSDDNLRNDRNGEKNLVQALLQDFGMIEPNFRFSQTRYLESKNKVDRQSIHIETWNKVVKELKVRAASKFDHYNRKDQRDSSLVSDISSSLWIVDLGAGLLSILDLLLHGDERGLMALISRTGFTNNSLSSSRSCSAAKSIYYTAYESNQELYRSCHARLLSWGFNVIEANVLNNNIESDITEYRKDQNGIRIRVKLIFRNFADTVPEIQENVAPDLVVGCCFADLIDPQKLVPSLIRSFGLLNTTASGSSFKGTLIYFPITFTGTTQFFPPEPFECQSRGNIERKTIPSDTVAFRSYARALEKVLGHNLNPYRLQDVMEDYGYNLIDFGPSDWKVDPERDSYLYETMLYFFGSTGGPEMLKDGWDVAGWIQRARNKQPTIYVTNRDLLFQMAPMTRLEVNKENFDSKKNNKIASYEHSRDIVFTDPYKVTTVQRNLPSQLGPRQVLILASYSLISSGTELKIFKGEFDDDATLDVNIKNMENERMSYPLSYGYCLVGVVVDCGSEVSCADYLGKTVFTFSPHATHIVTDADATQIIPNGIDAQDAIFMPSVETALSIVHDANVRLGENVAVYGQGLIGLLVTALLSRGKSSLDQDIYSGKCDSITSFDMIPARLAAASKMGASQALVPGIEFQGGPFDVSIEVSGNARALQSAIENTSNGGKIIVASYYGNNDVSLKLGIDFHRSHKIIQTSQVSEIPASLSRLWSKERRFAFTWELVRQIRPSRLLSKVLTLEHAQDAYEALDNGTEIAIAFDYT